jgi:hypothetical protein
VCFFRFVFLAHRPLCQTSGAKGQLFSKGLFGIINSSKKANQKIRFYYYDTSGGLVFVRFFGEIEDTKNTFRN